jgi:hypothetical protein
MLSERREKIKLTLAECVWDFQGASETWGRFDPANYPAPTELPHSQLMRALITKTCLDQAEQLCVVLNKIGLLSLDQNPIYLHAVDNEKVKQPPVGPYQPDPIGEPLELLLLFREFVIKNAVVWREGAGNAGHPIWSALANALETKTRSTQGYGVLDDPRLKVYLNGLNRRPLNQISANE